MDALLGIAVLEFRNANPDKYFDLLEKAYENDRNSPFLLLHIAEFFVLKEDVEKVLKNI